MSKVQERGLLEALGEADGLARVIRAMSDGRLDLVPVTMGSGLGTVQPLSFEAAKTEAKVIAGTMGKQVLTRVQETFCSTCGCLDEPGVHPQRDCPRYVATCAACGCSAEGYATGRDGERLCHTDDRRCYRDYVSNGYQLPDRAATGRPERS